MSVQSVSKIINISEVAFGTSGARGLVTDFKPEVCVAFTLAFIKVMQQDFDFKRLAMAIDNRPSSPDIAASCIVAAQSVGIEVDYYGVIPTPALAVTSMADNVPAIMVTGSHIPFDRNGLKFYRPNGEISKSDELAILAADVTLKALDVKALPDTSDRAAKSYLARYLSLFNSDLLAGKRIGIYEHSSAGRDLYAGLFNTLGAEVIALERSNEFVPIDTEAVSEADKLKAKTWSAQYDLDFIFSTDGDGDRPLVADENGDWLRGDILGLLCANAMNIEALAVPVSCNTAIESSELFNHVTRTKIGSPYVIAEFEQLAKKYHSVAGFEANGGFLLGSDVLVNNKLIKALPTRDALLPALMLLAAASEKNISEFVNALPQRFTYSDRVQNFATEKSLAILSIAKEQPEIFLTQLGFSEFVVTEINTTDGLRMTLMTGDIIHFRPSGNAPELRCYAESNSIEQAQYLVNHALQQIQLISL